MLDGDAVRRRRGEGARRECAPERRQQRAVLRPAAADQDLRGRGSARRGHRLRDGARGECEERRLDVGGSRRRRSPRHMPGDLGCEPVGIEAIASRTFRRRRREIRLGKQLREQRLVDPARRAPSAPSRS